MILWLFAALDILVLVSITTAHFDLFFMPILLGISAAYLVIKGLVFFGSFSAIVEMVFGVYIGAIAIFNFSTVAFYLIFVWMAAKLLMTISAET